MKTFMGQLSLAILLSVGQSASAASMTAMYEVSSAVGSGSDHSLWFSEGLQPDNTMSNHIGKDFDFLSGATMKMFDDGTARVEGEVVSQDHNNAGFMVDYQFGSVASLPFTPEWKESNGSKPGADAQLMDLVGGTLTGTGVLAGLNLSVTRMPVNGPYVTQIGTGIDASTPGGNIKNADLGMAVWFFTHIQSATCVVCTTALQSNLAGENGDMNVNLRVLPVVAPVPVPASGLLGLAGLGAFAAVRRRARKTQV